MSDDFKYNFLTPFKWFVLENFPFIDADFDALSNWQLFCKMGKEIQKIVDSTNDLGEQVQNLTDYLNNLDIQDAVDNKLDEMAKDGALQEIIASYIKLQGLLCYNSVSDLKNATNLVDGSFAKTFGFYELNDGGGAFYKIRTVTNQDVVNNLNIISITNDNTLVAELVTNTANVLQFGAKGDNETDNTLAFQTASNYAENNNLEFIVPRGTYLTGSFTLNNIKYVKLLGFIKMTDNNTILNIFENVNGETPNIFVNKVYPGTILMKGLNSADVTIQNCYKLRLVADNTENHNFIGYTKFYLGFVRYLELYDDGTGSKWINENLFFGGRFLGITIDGSYPHQNNLFFKPLCEHTVINFKVGVENRIIDARLEGSQVSITFAENTWANVITCNYSGTIQGAYIPRDFNSITVTDNSRGRNKVIKNEELNEYEVLNLNAFNNPKNVGVENGLLKPGNSTDIFASDYIELPPIDVCFYIYMSNPKVNFRLECYDENKQKLTSNPALLYNSPTLGYTSAGTYGNGAYNRNTYWALLDSSKNNLVKYIRIKFYASSSIGEETIKSIEMYLTYYGKLENRGYYLEGFGKSV